MVWHDHPEGSYVVKIGLMFRDVSTSLFQKPITERYPFVRKPTPTRLRGKLQWNLENCIGCGLCAKDCPANAILMHVLDRKEKRFVLEYHVDRCTFCAQCVHSCRQGCIELTNSEWELASLDRGSFEFFFGEQNDIEQVLDGSALSDSGTAEEG
jgi:formate hydrogenlyase subunit 6/NADH:ubiquinone oxidoreductase subunit I